MVLYDTRLEALDKAKAALAKVMDPARGKGKLDRETEAIKGTDRLRHGPGGLHRKRPGDRGHRGGPQVKQDLFKQLKDIAGPDAVLATNTSSLSVTAIGEPCPGPVAFWASTSSTPPPAATGGGGARPGHGELTGLTVDLLMKAWGKVPVIAKDTPASS